MSKLASSAVCVTIHNAEQVSDEWWVSLEPARAVDRPTPISVFSALHADADLLEPGLKVWSVREGVRYTFAQCSSNMLEDAQPVIKMLVAAQSFAAPNNVVTIAITDICSLSILWRLQNLGVVANMG